MLMRRTNFPTMTRTRTMTPRTLSNWLDDVFEDAFNWVDTNGAFIPELNVYETDTHFEITVELPGMSKDDIDISLDDNILTISGERKAHKEENGRRYHRVESRFGTFTRSLPLPNIVDTENVDATYENGVLAISITKQKEKAGRKIEVS